MDEAGRAERIARAEEALGRGRAAADAFEAALASFADAQADVDLVSEYLGSEAWFEDRDADAAGALDADARAGILSEDLGYNLIVDTRELALQMLELAAKMLRKL